MPDPAVDVIIPFYNRNKLLKRAIRSVYSQSWTNWNLLILDDGSTDKAFKDHYGDKTKLLRWESNRGVSYARNRGLQEAKANWIAFLDSDDEWLPEKLEKQMEYAESHPHYPLIHCNEIWLKNGKILNQKKKHKKRGGRIFIPSVHLCCVSPSAVLIKRSLFEELGFFREDFPVCEDYELWLRISSRYDVGFLDQALLIKHGGHEDQLSKKYSAMDYWRVKALLPYLSDNNLSLEEREVVRQELIKKSKILLKGYEKRKKLRAL